MSNNTVSAANTNDAVLDGLVAEGQERFAYISGNADVEAKDPSSKQEFYAALITALTGVEVTPKQYQAMISTHRYIQASDLNRARADYRPRTAASVIKAASTLLEHADQLVQDDAGAVIAKDSRPIPADIAEAVQAKLAAKSAEVADHAEQAVEAAVENSAFQAELLAETEEPKTEKQALVDTLLEQASADEDLEKLARRYNRKTVAQLQDMVSALV